MKLSELALKEKCPTSLVLRFACKASAYHFSFTQVLTDLFFTEFFIFLHCRFGNSKILLGFFCKALNVYGKEKAICENQKFFLRNLFKLHFFDYKKGMCKKKLFFQQTNFLKDKKMNNEQIEPQTNRNYKDSVFVDLFAHDETAKENFISLYNALHGTNLDAKTTEVQPVMLEQVLYMKFYNDIAMLVDGKIVVLVEHQSTINENMPFRMLEYIARIYEKITDPKKKFGKSLMKLPMPEFYVFYNGKEDFPSETVMKLSDAFMDLNEELFVDSEFKNRIANKNFPLEISVKVININVDKENPILQHCKVLNEYSEFIEQVKFNIDHKIPDPFTKAIKQSSKNGFLTDYLQRKSTEVQNMLLMEYDYATDIEVQREEAFEKGEYQAKLETAKNMLLYGDSVEKISKVTGLPLETIQSLK